MLLIMYLRKAFSGNTGNYLLTSFVPADEAHIDNGYQVDFVCKYLDYISVETYDYATSLKAGHKSPLHTNTEIIVVSVSKIKIYLKIY